MNKGIVYAVFVVMIGFLLWNIYMMGKIFNMKDDLKVIQEELDVCHGDVDILIYDLETSRDSVRILNSEIETIVAAQ